MRDSNLSGAEAVPMRIGFTYRNEKQCWQRGNSKWAPLSLPAAARTLDQDTPDPLPARRHMRIHRALLEVATRGDKMRFGLVWTSSSLSRPWRSNEWDSPRKQSKYAKKRNAR